MDFVNICCKALYFRGSLSICPAYAGVIPFDRYFVYHKIHLSRVCGGDPVLVLFGVSAYPFVPRMRG